MNAGSEIWIYDFSDFIFFYIFLKSNLFLNFWLPQSNYNCNHLLKLWISYDISDLFSYYFWETDYSLAFDYLRAIIITIISLKFGYYMIFLILLTAALSFKKLIIIKFLIISEQVQQQSFSYCIGVWEIWLKW